MAIQIGNFSSLFEVGVALNLSYSLFEQVRNLGNKNVEDSINRAIQEWQDEADLRDNDGIHTDKKQIKNVKVVAENTCAYLRKRTRNVSREWTRVCILGAIGCLIMLIVCALDGQDECSFANSGWMFLLVAIIGCSIMPSALIHIHLIWDKGLKDIKEKIKNNRESWDVGNEPITSVKELNQSVKK